MGVDRPRRPSDDPSDSPLPRWDTGTPERREGTRDAQGLSRRQAWERAQQGSRDRPQPWYAPHMRRDGHIREMWREHDPHSDPEPFRQRLYAERGLAPFDADKARRIPDWANGEPARGFLDIRGGPDLPGLRSGRTGGEIMRRFLDKYDDEPPEQLGFTKFNYHHVEAQAAAWLRLTGERRATLYVNKPPCATKPDGCHLRLAEQLPPGAELTVYAPEGIARTYRGAADLER